MGNTQGCNGSKWAKLIMNLVLESDSNGVFEHVTEHMCSVGLSFPLLNS
jgi:hypothetical protein